MSTDRETTLAVRSWLEEGVTRLPDRVLDAVLDQVPATPQRRHWWSAWRFNQMPSSMKLLAGAAALVVVVVVGYQFLPRNGGVGGQPTLAPLAQGTFMALGYSVQLEATGTGSSVTGRLVVTNDELQGGVVTRTAAPPAGDFTVDLQCARTTDSGLLWIAGDVIASINSTYAPKGTRAGIVIKPGSPAAAIFIFQMSDPRSASCQAFFDDTIASLGGEPTEFGPITGTLQLAP